MIGSNLGGDDNNKIVKSDSSVRPRDKNTRARAVTYNQIERVLMI